MPDGAIEAVRSEAELDYGPLRDSMGFLIRIAQLRIFEGFFRHVGDHGLKPGEFSVMWLIGRNSGIRQGVLAQHLMIKPAHMTKVIRGLEGRGYVVRSIPDDDRRAVRLALTAVGHDFVARHQSSFFAVPDEPLGRLAPRERDQLRMLLQKLVGLDHAPEGRTSR